MINIEHQKFHLNHFSYSWESIGFDSINISHPVSELTLNEIYWCLRKRIYLNPIIEICIDKISENWGQIDIYYPTEICQWYDEVIKEIITLPFSFWDNQLNNFALIQDFIKKSNKRQLKIEPQFIDIFLKYTPNALYWSNDDSTQLSQNIMYASCMEIPGNLIEAANQLVKVKYAFLNNQSVFIESESKFINNLDDFLEFIFEFHDEKDFIQEHILYMVLGEERIKTSSNQL
ncbi:MAG: hypothetical protein RLZZ175_2462 [Bacteroidota bacterium]|jgi:hypothetical protein